MSSEPLKGNGSLFKVTDADEYDRRTNGWFQANFPETYALQKAMPEGRDHPRFLALKHTALALGKKMSNEVTTAPDVVTRLHLLRKAVDRRKAREQSDTL